MEPQKLKTAVALLSVASNTVLVAFKILIGLLIGSVSVISEAVHSGVDLIASVIALVAVKTGAKPADERHPFGHGKIENVSGFVEAMLILFGAGWIVYEAVKKLIHPEKIDAPAWGAIIMLISAAVNFVVARSLFKVGRKTDSVALQADAWHHLTDVWTSVGVMAGLGILWLQDVFFPTTAELRFVDPVAAIVVALLIVKAGWDLTKQSVADLLDVQIPPEEEERVRSILQGFAPDVRGFHHLRTRKSGPSRFFEFHVFVDSRMTVQESHKLSHDIAEKIKQAFPGASVASHVEPCRGNCLDQRCTGCMLTEEQKTAVRESVSPPTPPAT